MTFSVLAVCIGNVCRSPVAEGLLRDRLPGTDFRVESAGVRGLVGHTMTEESAAELAQRGVHVSDFVARRLEASMPHAADLVLTATTDIRRAALEEAPGALRRTFTWKEFAALVDGRSAETPQALVRGAAARRAEVGHLDLETDDPIGRAPAVHARVAAEIDEAVAVIARALVASVRS